MIKTRFGWALAKITRSEVWQLVVVYINRQTAVNPGAMLASKSLVISAKYGLTRMIQMRLSSRLKDPCGVMVGIVDYFEPRTGVIPGS